MPRPDPGERGAPARPLSVGFYVTWDENSRASLRRHINQLDVVSPQWMLLDGSLGRVAVTSDPQAEAIIASAKNAAVDPADGRTTPTTASSTARWPTICCSIPAAADALITNLVALAKQRGYGGYVFDFENLSPQALAQYPALARPGAGGAEAARPRSLGRRSRSPTTTGT